MTRSWNGFLWSAGKTFAVPQRPGWSSRAKGSHPPAMPACGKVRIVGRWSYAAPYCVENSCVRLDVGRILARHPLGFLNISTEMFPILSCGCRHSADEPCATLSAAWRLKQHHLPDAGQSGKWRRLLRGEV